MLTYNCKLRVDLFDYAGNQTSRVGDDALTIVGDSLATTVDAGWNLWGAQLNPRQDSMHINLGDDFSNYWVTYDYVNNGYTFDGFLSPEAGYWLGTVDGGTVDVVGDAVTSDTTVSLSPGWNLISNPLVVPIPKDSLRFESNGVMKNWNDAITAGWINTIYGYQSGGYTSISTLDLWKGYWLSVLDSSLSIIYPIQKQPAPGKNVPAMIADAGWGIAFAASSGQNYDSTTAIGAVSGATDVFDNQYDAVKPPLPPGDTYMSLDIMHPEWHHPLGNRFARDFRASLQSTQPETWKLVPRSSGDDVSITWQSYNLPGEFQIGYRTDRTSAYSDLQSIESLQLSSGDTLWITAGQNVLSNTGEVGVPQTFALHQNYPNPFNPTTTIQFDLPEEAWVKVTIYNVAGQLVEILANKTYNAGYQTLNWNASGVNSGLYFYRIDAGNFHAIKKCMLLK